MALNLRVRPSAFDCLAKGDIDLLVPPRKLRWGGFIVKEAGVPLWRGAPPPHLMAQ